MKHMQSHFANPRHFQIHQHRNQKTRRWIYQAASTTKIRMNRTLSNALTLSAK